VRRNFFLSVGFVLCACGLPQLDDENFEADESTTSEVALSVHHDAFVTLRADRRKCVWPMCGGYFVTEANATCQRERYVNGLDFSHSGLDEASVDAALAAPAAELVVAGHLGPVEPRFSTRSFVVTEAFRGLPGVSPARGAAFVTVETQTIYCVVAPCPQFVATLLNRREAQPQRFDGTIVAKASATAVDQPWLVGLIEEGRAIAAGNFGVGEQYPTGDEKVLLVSQEYLRLPVVNEPCPVTTPPVCAVGEVNAFVRTIHRCIEPQGCVKQSACEEPAPSCEDGYSLASWMGPKGCPEYACDPSFTVVVK
jgi:hypothetical protein